MQLLDLMHTFHTRAAAIFSSWAAEEPRVPCETNPEMIDSVVDAQPTTLWTKCWCPLLQGNELLFKVLVLSPMCMRFQ